eukprot:9843644-Alexandrium_andersonii.AAC.1
MDSTDSAAPVPEVECEPVAEPLLSAPLEGEDQPLANLEWWDGVDWSELRDLVPTIVEVPPQLHVEVAAARERA